MNVNITAYLLVLYTWTMFRSSCAIGSFSGIIKLDRNLLSSFYVLLSTLYDKTFLNIASFYLVLIYITGLTF